MFALSNAQIVKINFWYYRGTDRAYKPISDHTVTTHISKSVHSKYHRYYDH